MDRLKTLVTGKQQGFTLLELLVSLLILSMVTTVVAFSLSSEERTLDSRVNSVMGVLKSSRNSAILSGVKHKLIFENGHLSLSRNVAGQWEKQKAFLYRDGVSYQVLDSHRKGGLDRAREQANTHGQNNILFHPDGLNTGFTVKLSITNNHRCISSIGNGQLNVQTQC